ncbi:meiotic recombination protein REC114-like isoform X1 [Diadema setosum]|uniref:meiotic recombination protein REC114-like isoform X1 n=1 Tax=Diadema setosum TaxID=31175 RepID=UPI003B3AA060
MAERASISEEIGVGKLAHQWELLKYARYLISDGDARSFVTTTPRKEQQWKYISPTEPSGLKLTVTKGHLLLTNSEVILENYFLPDMRGTIRGFVRGDSLLFVIKIKNEARKFRVRFAKGQRSSGEAMCDDCVSCLSFFFPVKLFEPPRNNEPSSTKEDAKTMMQPVRGEVPISDMSKSVSDPEGVALPTPYLESSVTADSGDLNKLLRFLLTDATFPAFVGAVERELKAIESDE